jgi:hypothetical protein
MLESNPVKRTPESQAGAQPLEPLQSRVRAIEPRQVILPLLVAALAIFVTSLSSTARSATYKWVDDKGVVHYTDKMPTEGVNKGSTVLDKQARPVKKIDPPLTPEQIRAREEEAELARVNAKAQEETVRRDRALMQSYTTEAEIEFAKSRAVGTIDSQIASSRSYTVQLTKRREDLELRKAKAGGKALPAALERELEANDSELTKTAALIEVKLREQGVIVARYEADKLRWRELKAISDANASAAAAAATSARTHPAASASNSSTTSVRK